MPRKYLAPTTQDDPQTVGVSTLGLPLVFGGMATAVLLLLVYKGSTGMRLIAATTIALLGGFTVGAILQYGFGALDGSYWLTSLSIAAGILAISATVLGLGTLIGTPGIGIGALTMLFVANPLSGLANGPQWLPGVWGEVGQLLPVGAAGSLVRSVAFFDGGGATRTSSCSPSGSSSGSRSRAWVSPDRGEAPTSRPQGGRRRGPRSELAVPSPWHTRGMAKVRVSTTVDADLLERARAVHGAATDASLVEASLQALLRSHRAAEIDEAYLRAYREAPADLPDEWGDLGSFLDEAARR